MAAPSSTSPARTTRKVATPVAHRLGDHRRDLRLVGGIALILVSVVVGSRLVAGADHRAGVWAASSSLSAGTTLSASDLQRVEVAMDDTTLYLPADSDLVGSRLVRDVGAGELLAASAVGASDPSKRRLVTVAVDALHFPPGLARGEKVDVYVTPKDGASVGTGADVMPALVLSGALVADPGVADDRGVTGQLGVVLDVAVSDSDRAVAAARGGDVDLVRVGTGP